MANTDKLLLVYGDVTLGVHGEGFDYIFSYQTGGPESIVMDEKEWLYRTPKPTFWRATTDNDRGNKFSQKSAMWLAADMFLPCIGFQVYVDGTENKELLAPSNNKYTQEQYVREVKITYVYETVTIPSTKVFVSYTVQTDGKIMVEASYKGKAGLPELPVFGMRFVMPTKADGYRYEGLSGETYPDRMNGGENGIYEVEGLPVTPYLVPQECGMHMNTKWAEVYRTSVLANDVKEPQKKGFRISSVEKTFAFSCLPYTAEELENAMHQEELPPARRTVLCVCGAVRGVGGIDSWGADVEEAYRISGEEDITYRFCIEKA